MSDPYVGEIRMFAGNFAPSGWAFCNGQELAISENTVLFNLIGTTYGGNGTTTFGLPNLQGRTPLGPGGPLNIQLGSPGGESNHTLIQSELPAHQHAVNANNGTATAPSRNAMRQP